MDFPPPLPPEPSAPSRWWRRIAVVVVLGVAIGLIGSYVTIPYYTLGPGPAKDVGVLISVDGRRTYPSDGAFLLTTVAVSTRPLSLFEALVGWIDPAVSITPRQRIVRPGLSDEQQAQYNLLDMEESKYSAVVSALRVVGIDAPPLAGVRVIGVAKDFPADGVLKSGDVILSIERKKVEHVGDVVEVLTGKPPGTSFDLNVVRGETERRVTVRTVRSPDTAEQGRPVIGAALGDAYRLPVGVTVDSQNIGGPSAGLAFALTIADVMIPEDLTRGHRVAVTGTIDLAGRVGPVGGVEFKVRAAEREGADVFLVPKDEVGLASGVASDAEIIGVATLQEAIEALRKLERLAPAA